MNALMPAPVLSSLRKEMDRLFERMWDGDLEASPLGEWNPPLELSETDEAVTVRLEVPGIDPKDIHVNLKHQVLVVRGEKRRQTEQKDERFYRLERCYGTFARSVQLPTNVRADKVEATFKHGVLTVTLPKAPEARGTEVPVKLS